MSEANFNEQWERDVWEAGSYERDTAAEEADHLREQHADRMERFADPRPAKRIVASKAQWVKLRAEKAGPCRGCGCAGQEFHHTIPRGQRGDDVADNLIPLCILCHGTITNGSHRDTPVGRAIASNVRASLTPAELAYVRAKKGDWWLDKHLPLLERAA